MKPASRSRSKCSSLPPRTLSLELAPLTLKVVAIVGVVFIHGAVLVDSAVRWERGLGFARPTWLGLIAALVPMYVALGFMTTARWSRWWLIALPSFIIAACSFCMASTGMGVFDWINAPLLSFGGRGVDWSNYLFDQGGLEIAFYAAIAHVALAAAYHRTRRRPSLSDFELGLFVLGFCMASLGQARSLHFVFVYMDPRARDEGAVAALGEARRWLWFGAQVIGLVLTLAAVGLRVARHAWLVRVRAGRVSGWRVLRAEALRTPPERVFIRAFRQPLEHTIVSDDGANPWARVP